MDQDIATEIINRNYKQLKRVSLTIVKNKVDALDLLHNVLADWWQYYVKNSNWTITKPDSVVINYFTKVMYRTYHTKQKKKPMMHKSLPELESNYDVSDLSDFMELTKEDLTFEQEDKQVINKYLNIIDTFEVDRYRKYLLKQLFIEIYVNDNNIIKYCESLNIPAASIYNDFKYLNTQLKLRCKSIYYNK